MHLRSSGELTPLKNVYENMLTHVHKVIYLVAAYLSKGGEVGEVKEVFFTIKQ